MFCFMLMRLRLMTCRVGGCAFDGELCGGCGFDGVLCGAVRLMVCFVGAVRFMVCFVGAVRPPTLRKVDCWRN